MQEFNRDISICVLNTFLEIYRDEQSKKTVKTRNVKSQIPASDNKIKILEALSATGLRSIRYAKEVTGVDEIIANDLMEEAVEMIKKNIKINDVENLVIPNQADAM